MAALPSPLAKPRERTGQAFLLALAAAALMFLPFLIWDRGYFIYYGDFNVQQIPFYRMAHDAVREGNIFWSWTTDLGANFIGSYSFYLLGSPFFWITLLFPSAAVPYLMAPLLILKLALSSLTAYLFLRRFVRPDYAVLGGLLYAFSGFSIYNIFFNHFHEAIVYFPLMLLAMELYMKEGRRGFFAVIVCLSALSNYYFFIGQAFFLMIYWLVRAVSGEWKCTFGKFFWLVVEALVGTAMAGVLLLPSFYSVIQNPRTESLLSGWDLLIYNKPQRLFDILHSFFFPQDIPARASFFPDSDNKWASMSAWLPVFGCSGVIAYFQSRRHTDWLRRLLIVLFFFAVIPGLNALFQLFNWIYYARWYYMMVLFLALATVKTLDEAEAVPVNWARAFGWTGGITAFFALFIGLVPESWEPDEETGEIALGLYDHPELFWAAVAFAAVCLILSILLTRLHDKERRLFYRWSVGVTGCIILIFGWYSLGMGKAQGNFTSRFVIERGIEGADKISLPELDTCRIDFNEGMDNLGMFWQIPTIQAFQSVVPGSIMEFYPTIGVERSVGSRPDTSHYALRGLLSVRYLFDYMNEDNGQYKEDEDFFEQEDLNGQTTYKMPGWTFHSEQNGFRVYENEYYIPFGFTYDYYMTRSQYNDYAQSTRELALLKALVVEDDQEEAVSALLPSFEEIRYTGVDFSQQGYFADCEARRATAASSFTRDNRGFTAVIDLPQDNYVFFSVPYEEGWTATVNGEPAEILKANVGFMAVACPAGQEVVIRFDYFTPGLKNGALISLGALLLLLLYLICLRRWDRYAARRRTAHAVPSGAANGAFPPEDGESLSPPAPEQPAEPPSGSGFAGGDPDGGPPPDGGEPGQDAPDGFSLYQYYPGTQPARLEKPDDGSEGSKQESDSH